MTAALPAGWCPTRPAAERIARHLLHDRHPADRYDLTSDRQVRSVYAEHGGGHGLQERLDRRALVLAEETARVQAAIDLLADMVGLAALELAVAG